MRSLRRHGCMRRARRCTHAAAHPRHSRTTAWRASPPCGRHGRPRARRHPHPCTQPHPRVGASHRPDHRNDRRATDPSETTLAPAHPPACTPPPRTRRACPHPPAHAVHSRGSCGRTSPHAQATPAVKTPALLTPALSAVAQAVCPTHTPSPLSAPARPSPPHPLTRHGGRSARREKCRPRRALRPRSLHPCGRWSAASGAAGHGAAARQASRTLA